MATDECTLAGCDTHDEATNGPYTNAEQDAEESILTEETDEQRPMGVMQKLGEPHRYARWDLAAHASGLTCLTQADEVTSALEDWT